MAIQSLYFSLFYFLSSFIQDAITKILQRGWPISNTHLFLTFVQAGKSKVMVLASSLSVRVHFLVHRCRLFSLCSHMAKGTRDLSRASF